MAADRVPEAHAARAPEGRVRFAPGLLRFLLGTVISLISLALAFRGVHLENAWAALLRANLWLLTLAVVSLAVSVLTKAVRWRILFAPRPTQPGVGVASESLLVGQLLNIALPLRVGDVARAVTLGQWYGESKAYTLGTIAVEKIFDLWMEALLALALAPFIAFPAWFQNSETVLAALALVLLAASVLLLRARRHVRWALDRIVARMPERLRPRALQSASLALDSLDALNRWDVVAWVWLWTIVSWAVSAATNWLVFWALGLDLSYAAALFLLVVLQAGIAVPSSPGKLGVFQFLCILTLGVLGVDPDLAFSYSWVLYVVALVPPSLAGTVILWYRSIRGQPVAWRG